MPCGRLAGIGVDKSNIAGDVAIQGVLFVSLGCDVSLITDHPVGLKDEPQIICG